MRKISFDQRIRIGITEKNQNPYWDMVNAGWQDAAASLGMDLLIEAPESEDIDEQLAIMNRQLDDGVDALAFVATRSDTFDAVVAKAHAMGVPVVAFDLDAPDSGRLMFVGMPGIREVGRAVGDFLAKQIPAGATVIAQTGSDHAPGAAAKLAGFLESMSARGNRTIVGDSDGEDIGRSLAIADRLLAENPDAAGMFGVYGYHPVVQAQAARTAGRAAELTIVGFDMLPETVDLIEQGSVSASVWIQEYYFGYFTAVAANNLVRLGSTDVLRLYGMDPDRPQGNTVYPPVAFFTKENIEDFRRFADAKSLDSRTALTAI